MLPPISERHPHFGQTRALRVHDKWILNMLEFGSRKCPNHILERETVQFTSAVCLMGFFCTSLAPRAEFFISLVQASVGSLSPARAVHLFDLPQLPISSFRSCQGTLHSQDLEHCKQHRDLLISDPQALSQDLLAPAKGSEILDLQSYRDLAQVLAELFHDLKGSTVQVPTSRISCGTLLLREILHV